MAEEFELLDLSVLNDSCFWDAPPPSNHHSYVQGNKCLTIEALLASFDSTSPNNSNSSRVDRLKGMLAGVAVGEALGLLAASPDRCATSPFSGLLDRAANQIQRWRDSPRQLAIGQCGESTELTFSLASCLYHQQPGYYETNALQAYLTWANNLDPQGRTWKQGEDSFPICGPNARYLWSGIRNPALFRQRLERRFGILLHNKTASNYARSSSLRTALLRASLRRATVHTVEEIAQLADITPAEVADFYQLGQFTPENMRTMDPATSSLTGKTTVSPQVLFKDRYIGYLCTAASQRRQTDHYLYLKQLTAGRSQSLESLARCSPLAVVDFRNVVIDTRLTNPHPLAIAANQRYVVALSNLLENNAPHLVIDHCCRVNLGEKTRGRREWYDDENRRRKSSVWIYEDYEASASYALAETDTVGALLGWGGRSTDPWAMIGQKVSTHQWDPSEIMPIDSPVERAFGTACWALSEHYNFQEAMDNLVRRCRPEYLPNLPWWGAIAGGMLGAHIGFQNMYNEPKTHYNLEKVFNCQTQNGDLPRPPWRELRYSELDNLACKLDCLALAQNNPYLLSSAAYGRDFW